MSPTVQRGSLQRDLCMDDPKRREGYGCPYLGGRRDVKLVGHGPKESAVGFFFFFLFLIQSGPTRPVVTLQVKPTA